MDDAVADGISQSYLKMKIADRHLSAMGYRMHDMTTSSSRNMEMLQEHFRRVGFVFLMPEAFDTASPGIIEMDRDNLLLGIKHCKLSSFPHGRLG